MNFVSWSASESCYLFKYEINADDLLTGADSVDVLKTICNNSYVILQSAGFNLRKCNSNTFQIEESTIFIDKSVV